MPLRPCHLPLLLSTTLTLLLLSLWLRSHHRIDTLSHTSPESPSLRQWSASLWSDAGSLTLHTSTRQNPPRGLRPTPATTLTSRPQSPKLLRSFGPGPPLDTHLGFALRTQTIPSYFVTGINGVPVPVATYSLHSLAIPHWLPTSLAALYPLAVIRRHLLHRRLTRHPNRCPTCHYDLRATPTRCPECGTPVPENTCVPLPSPTNSPP